MILTGQLEKSAGHMEYSDLSNCEYSWKENEEDKLFLLLNM